MSSLTEKLATGRQYWQSLEEYAGTPEFTNMIEREFPSRASEFLSGDRRRFLKLMGASLALAGLAGCRRYPVQELAPYAHRPANRDPGVPVQYTTAMDISGIGQGLMVTSYDGRPIKVDGNPSHPMNHGGSDSYDQASIMTIYDPDRARGVVQRANGKFIDSNWVTFFEDYWKDRLAEAKKDGGRGFAILAQAYSSPSLHYMRTRLQKTLPHMQWFEYEPISFDNGRLGTQMAFGKPVRVVPELNAAQIIVAIDYDMFVGDPLSVKLARDFAEGRRMTNPTTGALAKKMNRFYAIESTFSITGSQAENMNHRMSMAGGDIVIAVALLAAELKKQGLHLPIDLPAMPAAPKGFDEKTCRAMAADLLAHKGQSVITVGHHQPPVVHALAAVLNDALGGTGRTVKYYDVQDPDRKTHVEAITELTNAMNTGKVKTLAILGGNPVFTAPNDLNFGAALAKVPDSIHLADYDDETSALCQWHLPESHYLENWSDARSCDGLISIVQPMIEPIFNGKSPAEVVAILNGETHLGGYQIAQDALGIKASQWKWKKALFDGYIEGTAWSPAHVRVHAGDLAAALGAALQSAAGRKLASNEFEIVFRHDTKMYDGRWANSGWLQELPDPMTRLTWDNAAMVNPKTAQALGLNPHVSQMIEISIGERTLKMPVYALPGQPENSISLPYGYGRTKSGVVGTGTGFDVYQLRTSTQMDMAVARVKPTGETYQLATTQNHFVIGIVGEKTIAERIPQLVHMATFKELQANPSLGHKRQTAVNLWDEHHYNTGYQWGLSVDLTSCIACGACVVACQAENNIPIVGKAQVLNGREMQWMRIDRYFRGPDLTRPESVHEPVMCMQCENAPCEAVCPVGATVHSQDGLNQMVYNRCIGTRYCMNNCPYKVRRFNFFDYNSGTLQNLYEPNLLRKPMNDLVAMQRNPEVSIRVRGVMEKCTYCVQRIEMTRVTAERQNRRIRDGEIVMACQQACPTQAIVFGDILDKSSKVAILRNQSRSYGLLNEMLFTKPRTTYLPKISNPNPQIPPSELPDLGSM